MATGPAVGRPDRQRRVAFLLAAAFALVVTLGIQALGGPRSTNRSVRRAAPRSSAPRIADASWLKLEEHSIARPRAASVGTRTSPSAPAAVFPSITGQLPDSVSSGWAAPQRQAILASAREFVRRLLTRSHLLSNSQIRSLKLGENSGGAFAAVYVTIEHRGWLSGLTIYLEGTRNEWLVTSAT